MAAASQTVEFCIASEPLFNYQSHASSIASPAEAVAIAAATRARTPMPVSTVAATAASATQAAAKSSLADEQLAGRAPTTALGFGRTCVTARPREGTERLSSFFSLMEAVATIPLGPTAVTDPRWPSSFVPSLSTMVEECRTAAMGRVVMTPFAFANVAPTRETPRQVEAHLQTTSPLLLYFPCTSRPHRWLR